MDGHIWQAVYQAIKEVDKSMARIGRRPTYKDVQIVALYVWSVWHDRPLCWACQRSHYSSVFRPAKLPSVSQFCRRIKTARCETILQKVYQRLAGTQRPDLLSFLDARPLVVGACSKDRDARAGRIYGGFARGYKLHAYACEDGRIPVWSVTSLNRSEPKVAEELIRCARPGGLVLADGNYDSGTLYEAVAQHGGRLLTPLPQRAGRGHRRPSPKRLEAIAGWHGIAGYIYRERIVVERIFAHQSAFGGGLGPLPAWVRTLPRVRRWVGTKLIIYHARLAVRKAVS